MRSLEIMCQEVNFLKNACSYEKIAPCDVVRHGPKNNATQDVSTCGILTKIGRTRRRLNFFWGRSTSGNRPSGNLRKTATEHQSPCYCRASLFKVVPN